MIVSKIVGGLGNQLFQFAAGFSLSKAKNTNFGVDLSFYSQSTLRRPDFLNLNFSNFDFTVFEDSRRPSFIGAISRVFPYFKRHHFVERRFCFDPNFFNSKSNTFLEGYWQSEKYFRDVSTEVRSLIDFPIESRCYEKYEHLISNEECIGVHVRRGDYLNSSNIAVHGVCDIKYFLNSMEFLRQLRPGARFLFFSDDIEWCKQAFSPHGAFEYVQVDPDERKDNEELKLLSMCQSQIISNSTFGWWAAWFNNVDDKVVVAPKNWFSAAEKQSQVRDLIPDSWITL